MLPAMHPPLPARNKTLAHILLFITPALFSTNMLLARVAADYFPPVALATWRWGTVCLLLLPVCGRELWRQRAALRREAGELMVLGALGMGICGAVVYMGAATTTAINIGLIYTISPVLILLLSALMFGDKLVLRQGVGTCLALAGVLFIILRGDMGTLLSVSFSAGDLLILLAAMAWALYSVLLKRWPSSLGLTARLAATAGAGAIVMLPFLAWEHVTRGPPVFDGRTIATLITAIFLPGLLAYGAHSFITRNLGPSLTGLMLYLSPVYTALLAWLMLGETFAFYHWAGSAMVLPGLYLATYTPSRPQQEAR